MRGQLKRVNKSTSFIIIIATMALGKKAYPKATVKKIIKAHSNHNIKKNADVTVRVDRLAVATCHANVYML